MGTNGSRETDKILQLQTQVQMLERQILAERSLPGIYRETRQTLSLTHYEHALINLIRKLLRHRLIKQIARWTATLLRYRQN